MIQWLKNNILRVAFAQAFVAMMGSLYFSEVMNLPPCVLCWYQRIAMYPLVAIFMVGILKRDKAVWQYVLPLSLIGLGISVYHNLLYWNIIPEAVAPCRLGISCTTKFFEWFGFITIPFLSLTAFTVITASMLLYRKWIKS
jgi:disulfide bond formation protein DsbB